jgi:membrane-anchored protein YejM (alkaline phosphatase superfamily)
MTALTLLLSCSSTEPRPAAEPAAAPPRPLRSEPARHLVIIVIDTLRADALRAADTPHIDDLAAQGQRVPRAWSSGTWTVPGVTGLMTGSTVRGHGWDLPTGRLGNYPRLPDVPMLAQVLSEQGFTTTGLYSNGYLAEELGFDRGFDEWRRVSDQVLVREFQKTLARRWSADPEGRHFAYLHFLGPHSPVSPSAERRDKYDIDPHWFEGKRDAIEIGAAKRNSRPGVRGAYAAAYRGVIEDTDDRVGELLEALEPWLEDTLVILTSDHGELLGEHNIVGHGYWVYEGLTNVPYVVVNAQTKLPQALSTAATAQLVCDELGIERSWPVAPDTLPIVSQREGKLAMTLDGRRKAIWDPTPRGGGAFSVFDLEADPDEQDPLGQDLGFTQARQDWEASVPLAPLLTEQVELSEETFQQLEELGYIQ